MCEIGKDQTLMLTVDETIKLANFFRYNKQSESPCVELAAKLRNFT
jgi:hypothetical protein